jgi:hypothetical protein
MEASDLSDLAVSEQSPVAQDFMTHYQTFVEGPDTLSLVWQTRESYQADQGDGVGWLSPQMLGVGGVLLTAAMGTVLSQSQASVSSLGNSIGSRGGKPTSLTQVSRPANQPSTEIAPKPVASPTSTAQAEFSSGSQGVASVPANPLPPIGIAAVRTPLPSQVWSTQLPSLPSQAVESSMLQARPVQTLAASLPVALSPQSIDLTTSAAPTSAAQPLETAAAASQVSKQPAKPTLQPTGITLKPQALPKAPKRPTVTNPAPSTSSTKQSATSSDPGVLLLPVPPVETEFSGTSIGGPASQRLENIVPIAPTPPSEPKRPGKTVQPSRSAASSGLQSSSPAKPQRRGSDDLDLQIPEFSGVQIPVPLPANHAATQPSVQLVAQASAGTPAEQTIRRLLADLQRSQSSPVVELPMLVRSQLEAANLAQVDQLQVQRLPENSYRQAWQAQAIAKGNVQPPEYGFVDYTQRVIFLPTIPMISQG